MATRAKHTPGPWRVAADGTTVICGPEYDPLIVCHTEGDDLLHVGNDPDQSEEGQPEANARLIASAPDLLAALEAAKAAFADILDNHPDVWPARGKRGKLTPERQAWRQRIFVYRNAVKAALSKAGRE